MEVKHSQASECRLVNCYFWHGKGTAEEGNGGGIWQSNNREMEGRRRETE